MRLREPDQVQFVLLAFAQPSPWIASLEDVTQGKLWAYSVFGPEALLL
jgi:hypothetical protein